MLAVDEWIIPSTTWKEGDLFRVWEVNANDKEQREDEVAHPSYEEESLKRLVGMDVEWDNESETDTALGKGEDITRFWPVLSRRTRSRLRPLILVRSKSKYYM